MIRRTILTVALLAATMFVPAMSAHAAPAVDCSQAAKSPASVKALIQCAAPRIGVSTSIALCIAYHESKYEPWADNPHSSAAGVYQVVSGTWTGFVRDYLYGHRLSGYVKDGRSNVIISLRYARHRGWGPWQGGPCV